MIIVKDSYSFVYKLLMQDINLDMASLDFDSLFSKIPLDETIDICVKKLFGILKL